MSSVSYRLPGTVGKLLSRLPAYPGSMLFVGGLNMVLKPQFPDDTLAMLEGHALRICVNDAGIKFDFICRNGSFSAAKHSGPVALTIRASAHDFLLLMQRKEDPDTLFFSRRLSMEGDTELGLMVKNTLDAIDLSDFKPLSLITQRLEKIGGYNSAG